MGPRRISPSLTKKFPELTNAVIQAISSSIMYIILYRGYIITYQLRPTSPSWHKKITCTGVQVILMRGDHAIFSIKSLNSAHEYSSIYSPWKELRASTSPSRVR